MLFECKGGNEIRSMRLGTKMVPPVSTDASLERAA